MFGLAHTSKKLETNSRGMVRLMTENAVNNYVGIYTYTQKHVHNILSKK